MSQPLVSVVTPFFNTAPYLAQCIESVLAQSYENFEYILMDNCSTDGSCEIAASYARRDRRIRLISCSVFLSQVPNYNRALSEISADSRYCKMVQADDWIFPRCLELMVKAFEQSESIGLVGSFWVHEQELGGAGLPIGTHVVSGREYVRWYFRTGISITGSQTQMMYRSSLVRSAQPFFNPSFSFSDLQRHIEILERWDFGFVHQVLSFWRTENESTLGAIGQLSPWDLLRYVLARRYASIFFGANEAKVITAKWKRRYYRGLARGAILLRGRTFWQFHKAQLKALGGRERLDWFFLAENIALQLLWLTLNPAITLKTAMHKLLRLDKRQSEITSTDLRVVGLRSGSSRARLRDLGASRLPRELEPYVNAAAADSGDTSSSG